MAPSNARAPATAGGKARALAPTAPPPAASASARAPAEVEDAAPAPPPLANLFKLCGVDGMKNITREGNVATVHDKFLGRKVLVVQGNVPAANFARLPKVGRPALGLTGGFLYAQVKLDPERVFAVHVDLICRDSSDESRSNASVGYQIGRKTVRLSLTNLYRRKTAPEPLAVGACVTLAHEPIARGWVTARFDLRAWLKKGQKKGDVAKTLTFESVRSVQLGGGISVRNVFVCDEVYDEESAPEEMRLSSKPDATSEWIDAGDVAPSRASRRAAAEAETKRREARDKKEAREAKRRAESDVAESDVRGAGVYERGAEDTAEDAAEDTAEEAQARSALHASDAQAQSTLHASSSASSLGACPPARRLVPSDAPGKPTRVSSNLGAARPDVPANAPGHFAVGGAGGAHHGDRASTVAGRAGDVDAVTGMPLADVTSVSSPPIGATVSPTLRLERVVGLSGERRGAATMSPDGRTAAYAAGSVVVALDLETRAQTHLFGHSDDVHLVRFSDDGELLVTAQRGRASTVRAWTRIDGTWRCVAVLHARASSIRSLDVSPDGQAVAVAGTDTRGRQLIAAWDVRLARVGGAATATLRHNADYHARCVRFSPFEDDVLFACGRNSVRAYRLRKGKLRGQSVHLGDLDLRKARASAAEDETRRDAVSSASSDPEFTTLAFAPSTLDESKPKKMFVGTTTGAVVQIDYPERRLECAYQLHDGAVNALCVSDGIAVSASDDGFVRVWPEDFSDFFLEAEHESAVTSASASADGARVLATTAVGSLGVLDVVTHKYETLSRSHAGVVAAVASDADAPEFATASSDGTARVWSADTGEQLYEFDAPGERATTCAFRPRPGTTERGDAKASNVSTADAGGVASRPQVAARHLAVGYAGGYVRVFDVDGAHLVAEHRRGTGAVTSVTFTPCGRKMLVGNADGTLCVHDAAADGFPPVKFLAASGASRENRGTVSAASPDGRRIAVVGPGADVALLFDADTLALVARFRIFGVAVAVAFDADSKSLLVASADAAKSVARYPLPDEDARESNANVAPLVPTSGCRDGAATCLATDPRASSSALLVVGGEDGAVRARPLESLRDFVLPPADARSDAAQTFAAHAGRVSSVAFSSDGARLYTADGGGKMACVWRVDRDATRALESVVPSDLATYETSRRAPGGLVTEAEVFGLDETNGRRRLETRASPSRALPSGRGGDETRAPPVERATNRAATNRRSVTPSRSSRTFGPDDVPTPGANANAPRDREPIKSLPPVSRATAMPKSAGYDAPLEPWSEDVGENAGAATVSASVSASVSRPAAIRPTRVMGLCTGAAAAAEETSENAAAVAASSASPPAMFIPELGALAYGAGAELAVERLGGDRTQALLRAHAHPITALAHHPSTRRIASASASADAPGETASVFLWDARTGAKTKELRHDKCGGGVVSLAFSPKGDKILSVGADPAGAVAVWDAVTGASLGRASAAAPAAGGAWCRGEAPEFVVFGAEGAALFRVLDQTPRRGENGENREEDDDVGDDVGDGDGDGDDAGDDDSDAGSTAAPKSNGLASAKFSFVPSSRDDADVGDGGEIPVCTAGCVSSDGALFLGDARGRLWRASFRDRLRARVGTPSDAGTDPVATDPVSDSVATDPVSSPPSLRLCVAALPSGEAATAVATAPENRVFVGSSRRARVWEETRGVGWEEIGELELDGAVVAARFPTDQGEDARDAECGTPSARSAISSDSAASRSLGVVTTSAGTAWSVDVFDGTARALVQAHPLDIVGIAATRVGARDALATVTADGAARAWDASSATKIVEAHADPDFAAARSAAARVAVAAPDGTHLVVGCGDGSLGVIRIVGAEREPSTFASRIDAHPEGGAVVAAAFAPTPIAPPRAFGAELVAGLTPLVSVAEDGSVAVTWTGRASEDVSDATKMSSVVAAGGLGGVDPATDAAVDVDATPALVAVARASGVRVYAVDVVESVAAETSSYAPDAETFAAMSQVRKPDVAGSKSAVVAWSASRTGVCYYAGRATAGKVVVFDADASRVLRVVDLALVSAPACVAVAAGERGGDVVLVGGDEGAEWIEIPSEVVSGFVKEPTDGPTGVEFRRGTMATPAAVRSATWNEDGRVAYVAAGSCVYACQDPRRNVR